MCSQRRCFAAGCPLLRASIECIMDRNKATKSSTLVECCCDTELTDAASRDTRLEKESSSRWRSATMMLTIAGRRRSPKSRRIVSQPVARQHHSHNSAGHSSPVHITARPVTHPSNTAGHSPQTQRCRVIPKVSCQAVTISIWPASKRLT